MAEPIDAEIAQAAQDHASIQLWDFRKAQTILWAGILSSLAASLQATGFFSWSPTVAAIVAIVPAGTILIDKTFKYAARSAWHALYGVQLRSLQRARRDRNVPPTEISERFDKLDLEMHNAFPPLDSSHLAPPRST